MWKLYNFNFHIFKTCLSFNWHILYIAGGDLLWTQLYRVTNQPNSILIPLLTQCWMQHFPTQPDEHLSYRNHLIIKSWLLKRKQKLWIKGDWTLWVVIHFLKWLYACKRLHWNNGTSSQVFLIFTWYHITVKFWSYKALIVSLEKKHILLK